MKSRDAERSDQAQAWYRRKTGFIVILLLTSLLIGSALGVLLYGSKPQKNNLTSFTCLFSSSSQTFTIAVEVNLTDGMDQDEAIKAAKEVFFKVAEMSQKKDVIIVDSLARMREDGTWMVEIDYKEMIITEPVHQTHIPRFSPVPGYFEALINPFNQTIKYCFQHHGL